MSKNLLLVYKFLQKSVTKLISLLNFYRNWYQSLQIFMRLNTFLIIFSIEKGKKQGRENHKKMRVVQTTNLDTYEWRCPICLDLCHLQMQHLHTLYTNQIKSVKKTNLNKFNSNQCTTKIHVNRSKVCLVCGTCQCQTLTCVCDVSGVFVHGYIVELQEVRVI